MNMPEQLDFYFKSLGKLYTEQRELAAIWLEKPVQTAKERTVRITDGMLVTIENGKLVDCTGEPTHKILMCLGTLVNQFQIVVSGLKDNQLSTINL